MSRAVVIADGPRTKRYARPQLSRARNHVFAITGGERYIAAVPGPSADDAALDDVSRAIDGQVIARMLTVTAQQNTPPLLIRSAITPLDAPSVVFAAYVNPTRKPWFPNAVIERYQQHAGPVPLFMRPCIGRWTMS